MRRRDLVGLPAGLLLTGCSANGAASSLPFPDRQQRERNPDRWWARFRHEHFLLPDDLAYLNTGTLGVAPRPVVDAVTRGVLRSATLGGGSINRWGAPIEGTNARTFDDLRRGLAASFGCRAEELTLTHNTTEALALVAGALDIANGDEVLITDQEHPANIVCWTRASRDRKVVVTRVPLPRSPRSEGEVLAAIERAITPRTRILSFPAVISGTGIRLPAAAIVALAKAHKLVTVVDGAHLPGQVPLDLDALGCDFLAASPHKWMFAPAGCGFLYGRGDGLARLARTVRPEIEPDDPAQALMQVGTNSGAIFDGFATALAFYNALGPEIIFARLSTLRNLMVAHVRGVPQAELYTPDDPQFSGGMVSFRIPGIQLRAFAPAFRAANISVAPGNGIRLSAHIHTRRSDIERFFTVLSQALAKA